MVEKQYQWVDGARLEEHSRRKHKILRQYIFDYVTVRCSLPQRERFRLAIVDGFAGGGRYRCGTAGSPIIFIEELKRAVDAVNIHRASQGLKAVEVECFLILNDANVDAIELLGKHVAPLQEDIKNGCQKLHLRIEYMNDLFEIAYPKIKNILKTGRYKSVLFNLDQCGDSHVDRATLVDIMNSFDSAEIFYTFMISALLAFLKKSQPEQLKLRLDHLGLGTASMEALNSEPMSRNDWLGAAEKIVFDAFHVCARYVSPFSINNPGGWRYWFIHFANSYRARQVYNNILHDNASLQAHFGRSGLNMLSYDPRHEEGVLYLFDDNARAAAKEQLLIDIPRLVTDAGDTITMMDFYSSIYSATSAHADDVHTAIINNPDLEVITEKGGERRRAKTIEVTDLIKIKVQRSFFPLFLSSFENNNKQKQ